MVSRKDLWYGKGYDHAASSSELIVNPMFARVQAFNPTGVHALKLIDARWMLDRYLGGAVVILFNDAASLLVGTDNTGGFLFFLPFGFYVRLYLIDNTTQAGTWKFSGGLFSKS